jgi:hypothetical protein
VANRGKPEGAVGEVAFWFECAADARTIAQHLTLPESRLVMLHIAAAYERLARNVRDRTDESNKMK